MDEGISRIRASAHPVRLQIMSLLTGAEMSATDVARELDITHANASYHLRTLEKAGLIEVAAEEKVRGGLVKRYRYPLEHDDDLPAPANVEERELYHRASAEELVRRGRYAIPGRHNHSADAEMWVTPEVYDRVKELVEEASDLIHREAQPPRTDGTIRANLTAFVFKMRDE